MDPDFKKYLDKAQKDEDRAKEKNANQRTKIEDKIFQYKVDKLNNILESEGIDFRFNIKKVDDHFEFDIPLEVLIGPKTRKSCADNWKSVMSKADINMDFSDELNRIIKSMSGIVVTMKLNNKMTQEIGQGEIKKK